MTAAVTESGRRRCQRPLSYRRPLQEAAVTGDRYRQEAGGGDGSGRYINNALRQDASTLTGGTCTRHGVGFPVAVKWTLPVQYFRSKGRLKPISTKIRCITFLSREDKLYARIGRNSAKKQYF
jgi:hypothetical protein